MAAVSVSHCRFLFARCPWYSAISCRFVECYVIHRSPPSFFHKLLNCKLENGVVPDVGVVSLLAVGGAKNDI
eukprot:13564633-Ditylum_brightwellii.AAC.1